MGKKKGKKGRAAKNAKAKCDTEPEELTKAPHSFVINRGRLGKNANELMLNFRKVMEPYTASQLKVKKNNVIKDFVHMAGPLNVSHLIVFTKSERGIYVRLGKLPRGPTLTFEVKEYCLARDIISSQKKSLVYEKLFEHHPLLVLNNFTGEGKHFKLMTTMFQNMIPSINVNKTNLNTIRRCLSLHYNEDKCIELRHYAIKIVPTGISKAVKKLIQSKVPNLGQYQNVGEFLQTGNLSESEAEVDGTSNTVVLPQPISSRGNIVAEKSAIRLYEIGPRMRLQLIKIEEGLMTGEVLFHEYIMKTPQEIAAMKARIKQKRLLKEQRREQQRKNVEKKKQLVNKEQDKGNESEDLEEDLEWYRKEVGEDPDENVAVTHKRKFSSAPAKPAKKIKLSAESSKLAKTKHSPDKKSENNKAFQQFLAKRKKRKEAKLLKKKSMAQSRRIVAQKAKHKEEMKIKKKL
ncbi:suppressor of SWI4 1 homolog [Uloborus diversus]|uniref:suppressor of SWI4 1 homolog n=1 Tax=Uloborus diversus TaxID=327109 RepID=UPI00240A2C6D|nr:suppressor of SWI4 1 homolog [Uloborus diversus]